MDIQDEKELPPRKKMALADLLVARTSGCNGNHNHAIAAPLAKKMAD
jgi:hypothetical protein